MSGIVVVVVRHPDFADEIEVFGGEARVVYLDLGSSFDVTHIGPEDAETVSEWASSIRDEVADLPADHAARVYVETQLEQVLEEVRSWRVVVTFPSLPLGMMTNRERASVITPLIDAFAEWGYGLPEDRKDTVMVVGDFLCDLRHYVEIERGASWDDVVAHADFHYTHEAGFAPDEQTD